MYLLLVTLLLIAMQWVVFSNYKKSALLVGLAKDKGVGEINGQMVAREIPGTTSQTTSHESIVFVKADDIHCSPDCDDIDVIEVNPGDIEMYGKSLLSSTSTSTGGTDGTGGDVEVSTVIPSHHRDCDNVKSDV